jgi:hypothetical protein
VLGNCTLATSEGRRIDGLRQDAGIVGYFWVFGGTRDMKDGKRKDMAVEIPRTHHAERSATGNVRRRSEYIWLMCPVRSSGRTSLPTWYIVVCSCLSWSTRLRLLCR